MVLLHGVTIDKVLVPILLDKFGRLVLSEDYMLRGFQIQGGHNVVFSPADSTIYYYGLSYAAPVSTVGFSKIYVLPDCTLRRVCLIVRPRGVLGTAQFAPVNLLVNGVDVAEVLPAVYYNVAELVYISSLLSIDISAGANIELKTTMPVFTTNPTNVEIVPSFYFEFTES